MFRPGGRFFTHGYENLLMPSFIALIPSVQCIVVSDGDVVEGRLLSRYNNIMQPTFTIRKFRMDMNRS